MTAHALAEERQRCPDAGMNDHVSKPIDPDALFATLARWTESRTVNLGALAVPARSAEEMTVPQIEGVEMVGGLQRVAGNQQFVARQGSAGAEIELALESGDRTLAERVAHSVRGVAGNSRIGAVFQLAGKAQSAIHESSPDVQVLLTELSSELDRQVQAIQGVLRGPTLIQEAGKGNRVFAPSEALAMVGRPRVLLEARDGDALDAYRTLG